MSQGSFDDFRDALRAFESGFDRARYDAGVIADWQLDLWAGGPVSQFFPGRASWGGLDEGEWTQMQYRSTNSLGFVGYQFGEALLIDLGYYRDDVFYGNGDSVNRFDGAWTGKNGAVSLEAFKTEAVQERAILDAFGYNLAIIEDGLAASGRSLAALLGTERVYVGADGAPVLVTLTLTGILAAAHLRGAWGTLALLEGGTVSADEYGTSILQYIRQFGGYDSPAAAELIAAWRGSDSGGSAPPPDAAGSEIVVDWSWGTHATAADFDPASDRVAVRWIGADALEVFERDGATVIAVPANNQSLTLSGVGLAELGPGNFTFLDVSARAEVLALLGGAGGGSPGGGGGGGGPGGGEDGIDVYGVDFNAPDIVSFDPARDRLDFGSNSVHGMIVAKTEDGEVAIVNPWGPERQVLAGVTFAELTVANFGVVANEHLRQDFGGVLSWELGLGPRDAGTVYVRSHEYGVHEVVHGFDPHAGKLSFLYYGTRELLTVRDTPEGLLVATEPTGQSVLLAGVRKADLVPANIEFHHDQIVEDRLEEAFGFAVEQLTLVSRTGLLTPVAPPGETTDGGQTAPGSGQPGHGHPGGGAGGGGGQDPQRFAIDWTWGAREVLDFEPGRDRIAFGWFAPDQIVFTQENVSTAIEIVGNNQRHVLAGVTLAELDGDDFDVPAWHGALRQHLDDLFGA